MLSSAWAQDEEEGAEGEPEAEAEAEPEAEAEAEAEPEGEPEGDAELEGDAEPEGEAEADGDAEDAGDGEAGGDDTDEEECEEEELGEGGDDIESILDPSEKKCKPKGGSEEDELSGSEALAAEVNVPFFYFFGCNSTST